MISTGEENFNHESTYTSCPQKEHEVIIRHTLGLNDQKEFLANQATAADSDSFSNAYLPRLSLCEPHKETN
jgi:hypothetical protein